MESAVTPSFPTFRTASPSPEVSSSEAATATPTTTPGASPTMTMSGLSDTSKARTNAPWIADSNTVLPSASYDELSSRASSSSQFDVDIVMQDQDSHSSASSGKRLRRTSSRGSVSPSRKASRKPHKDRAAGDRNLSHPQTERFRRIVMKWLIGLLSSLLPCQIRGNVSTYTGVADRNDTLPATAAHLDCAYQYFQACKRVMERYGIPEEEVVAEVRTSAPDWEQVAKEKCRLALREVIDDTEAHLTLVDRAEIVEHVMKSKTKKISQAGPTRVSKSVKPRPSPSSTCASRL